MKHGNEDTVREMLRIKRSVQATFNTQVNFMSAQLLAAQANKDAGEGTSGMHGSTYGDVIDGIFKDKPAVEKGDILFDHTVIKSACIIGDQHLHNLISNLIPMSFYRRAPGRDGQAGAAST